MSAPLAKSLVLACGLWGANGLLRYSRNATDSLDLPDGSADEIGFEAARWQSRQMTNRRLHGCELPTFSPVLETAEKDLVDKAKQLCSQNTFCSADHPDPNEHYRKFIFPQSNVELNMDLISLSNLRQGPRRRVFDIGSGAGWFVWMLRELGHTATGLEPVSTFPVPAISQITNMLGVVPVDQPVRANVKIDPPMKGCEYDVVTAWRVLFDRKETKKEIGQYWFSEEAWDLPEWQFFIRDLACNQLKPDGRIVMQNNPAYWRSGARDKVEAWLQQEGAKLEVQETRDGWRVASISNLQRIKNQCP